MSAEARQTLERGAAQMGLGLSADALSKLVDYWRLLQRWNRRFNLVARSDPRQWLSRHILDSLSLLPKLPAHSGWRALDAGSGAGLPGAVLAMARPDARYVLVDSAQRRCHFLQQMKMELDLEQIEVVHARLEDCRVRPRPQLITARALKPLRKLLPLLAPLCAPGTELLLPRSRQASVSAWGSDYELLDSSALAVPGGSRRHLLHLRYCGGAL